ncbi:ladderlectin-like [Paramormyrops kingsleyae]|uniref:ladderlectin-like n=1 Tax=Paramormyrops kingsleyae TaxID=1676925 RepID=UPI000CD65B42|nr:ladderlectin-like [Paramormyrops kingsleyae]
MEVSRDSLSNMKTWEANGKEKRHRLFTGTPSMAHTITAALLLCLLPLFGYGVEGQLRQQRELKLDTGFCQGPCPADWVSFKNRCFQYIADGKTWIDSELHCLSSGGNLASMHSEEEFQFIKALIKSRDSAENPCH